MARDAFEMARSFASRASPRLTHYQHASVILDRKGRIIAVGVNYYGGVSRMRKLGAFDGRKRAPGSHFGISFLTERSEKHIVAEMTVPLTVHSEFHALSKVDIRKLDGAVLVNYGRTLANTILARPCERSCWPTLAKLGFRKVIYTEPSPLNTPLWREEFFT